MGGTSPFEFIWLNPMYLGPRCQDRGQPLDLDTITGRYLCSPLTEVDTPWC